MPQRPIRSAIYDRVSSDFQVKEGLSLEAQRQALTDYALSHGYEIVGYYTDEGITARKKMQNRKDLTRLLEDVQKDKIDLILVTKLDRWFRNIKDYHNTQAILEAHNCNWKTIFEEYDTSTSNGRFAINIMLSVAENECDRDSERIKTVFDYKKLNREHLGGKPAYGYTVVDKKPAKDPAVRHIVEDVVERYFTTYSKKEVIRYIKSRYGASSPTAAQINHILSSDVYTGKRHGIEDYCEGYMTKEQFEKIRSISDAKIIPHQTEPFLFSSMIECPVCGRNMSGFVKRQKLKNGSVSEYKRYRCSAKFTDFHYGACITESIIEDYLKNNLVYVLDQEIMKAKEMSKTEKPKENAAVIRDEMDRLNYLFQKGRIKPDYYDEQYALLEDRLKAARTNTEALAESYRKIQCTLTDDWIGLYVKLDAAHKKIFWKSLIEKIYVDPESHEVCGFKFLL